VILLIAACSVAGITGTSHVAQLQSDRLVVNWDVSNTKEVSNGLNKKDTGNAEKNRQHK
jgi:hypothetical protein